MPLPTSQHTYGESRNLWTKSHALNRERDANEKNNVSIGGGSSSNNEEGDDFYSNVTQSEGRSKNHKCLKNKLGENLAGRKVKRLLIRCYLSGAGDVGDIDMSAAPETLPVASESRTRAPATAVSVPPPPVAAPPPPHRTKHVVHWFRKGLRLHDNPALREGLKDAVTFRCVFIIDPWFASSSNVGINKWRFLLQCLQDLDTSLKQLNSRLYVVRGQPADALPKLFKDWGTTTLSFEEDPEPYGRVRDHNITTKCREVGINVISHVSHTLYKLDSIIELNGGKAPLTYHQFQALIASIPPPPQAEASISLQTLNGTITPVSDDHDERFGVPSLEELGFDTDGLKQPVWIGGESEALARLERHLERKAWVASFGRPKMTPQSLLASQTGLSPYLRFGCLSTRLFYYQLTGLYMRVKQVRPPLSLHGQILWREFFYCAATRNPNFDRMEGNPICVQIPWDKNQEALAKWANGQTGFPWIDSIMVQLRDEGWIHHLARHAVACFLTRGDLWISWEEGMKEDPELSTEVDFLNERHRDLITIRDITNAPGTSDALDVQSYFVTKPTTTNAVIAQSDFTAGIENIYSTVFDELLLDADWSVNAGMWMWLSCSSFFQQFFHCYCPVRFGRKTDPNGDFIRRYIPALKNMPTRYIHEPWVAPEAVQVSARCIIGRDYPLPMVDHAKASHVNIERIKQVYAQLAKYKPQGNLNPNPVARPNMMQSSPSPTSIITSINQSNFLCSQTPEPQVTSTPTLISYNDDSVFQHPGKTATDKPTIKHVFIAQNTEKTKTTKNAKETPSPPSNRDGFTNQQTQDAANQVSFKANQGNEPQSQGKEKFAFKNYAINATNFVNQNYAAANELFRAQQLTRNKIIYAQQEVKFNSFDDEKVKFCMSALSENDIKVESGFIHSEVMQQRYIAAPLSQNYNTKKNPVSNNGKDQLKSTEGSLIQTINSDKTFPHAVHNNQTSSNENKPEDKGNTD